MSREICGGIIFLYVFGVLSAFRGQSIDCPLNAAISPPETVNRYIFLLFNAPFNAPAPLRTPSAQPSASWSRKDLHIEQTSWFSKFKNSRFLKAKKIRGWLAWVGVFLLFAYAKPSEVSFRIGTPVLVLGELIRIWASGFLEKKGKILATSGPFAYVRNPLYIGNYLIGLGVTIIAGNVSAAFIFMAGFALVYWKTIRQEEHVLRDKFGKAYEDYFEKVPRLIPRFPARKSFVKDGFRWRRLVRHREYLPVMGLISVTLGLYLWEEWAVEREFAWKNWLVVAALLLMGVLAAVERFFDTQYDRDDFAGTGKK